MQYDTIMVTGGLGFIGKHFIPVMFKKNKFVINVDMISYAADRRSMEHFANSNHEYQFCISRVEDLEYLADCDVIVNFAAESHVDNSISNSNKFLDSNIKSVHNLLEKIRAKRPEDRPRLIHISTDEVYGSYTKFDNEGFSERDVLTPSNPYSASKASAEMLIKAWAETYGIEYNIVRLNNVFGCHQYPEKLIPKTLSRISKGQSPVLHGDGEQLRSWLAVEDAVQGIVSVIEKGVPNTTYNIGTSFEMSIKEVIDNLLNIAECTFKPEYVEDRPGQDTRYLINSELIYKHTGWEPETDFYLQLAKIVQKFDSKRFLPFWPGAGYR